MISLQCRYDITGRLGFVCSISTPEKMESACVWSSLITEHIGVGKLVFLWVGGNQILTQTDILS